jgi:trehalose 6-phosphate synthase
MEGKQMLLGVDRLDYTKGIVERLLAVEFLLEEHPWYLEKIVFVQIAAPSRTRIPSYALLRVEVEQTVERINQKFQTSKWKPVILIARQCSHEEVARYYRAADVCVVTALHDGMNLVAKEYLASRRDDSGVLILSRFAGAAQELRDALIVNPYDVEQVGEAIRTALEMSPGESHLRMERLRHQVKEHNVYRWASNILSDLCAVRIEDEVLAFAPKPHRRLA